MRQTTPYAALMLLAGWLGFQLLCAPLVHAEEPSTATAGAAATAAALKDPYPKVPGGWVEMEYNSPNDKKIHLANPRGEHTAFDWAPNKDLVQRFGEPPYASYQYDLATDTETFQLYDKRSNRAEVRLYNEYEFGATMFEGYVTFYPPTDDESLFQIWGSNRGATQLMVRAFAANNGSIGINYQGGGKPKFLHDLYGKETKVNVIHLQEDMGNKILVYLNGQKAVEFPDNEKATNHDNKNYHKWGVYGTVRTGHESPKVQWRRVRHYAAGAACVKSAAKATTHTMAPPAARPEIKAMKSLKDAILPADKNGGFTQDGFILWCPSVIKVGDAYHLFCSRWPAKYGMGGWTKHSECVHATSKNLCGPYQFKEVALQKRADHWDNTRIHNVKIVKAGDSYVIYYIDTANETGFAWSPSIDGPWTRMDEKAMAVSNPAVYVKSDQSVYVFGRLGVDHVNRGIAFTAPSFKGPYTVVKNGDNLLADNCELEDPTIWWANNQYHVLLNDWGGKATGVPKGGAHYCSKDGLHYTLMSKEPVFTKKVDYRDGSSETFRRRERPFIFANEQGEALALFTACYYQTAGGGMEAKIVANPIDRYLPAIAVK